MLDCGLLLLSKDLLETSGLVGAASVLLLLEISETAGLGVDFLHLFLAFLVKLGNLLASRGAGGLLKVRVQAQEEVVGLLGEVVGLIGGPGTVGRLVLLVKARNGVEEAVGHAVGVIEL